MDNSFASDGPRTSIIHRLNILVFKSRIGLKCFTLLAQDHGSVLREAFRRFRNRSRQSAKSAIKVAGRIESMNENGLPPASAGNTDARRPI